MSQDQTPDFGQCSIDTKSCKRSLCMQSNRCHADHYFRCVTSQAMPEAYPFPALTDGQCNDIILAIKNEESLQDAREKLRLWLKGNPTAYDKSRTPWLDLDEEYPTTRYFIKQVMYKFGIKPGENIASCLDKLHGRTK